MRNLKKRMHACITGNKKEVLVTVALAIAITLIFMRTYQFQRAQIERYTIARQQRIAFVWAWQAELYTGIDILLLIITSFVAGIFLSNTKTMIYSFFAAIFLSFLMGVVYCFLFVTLNLEIGTVLMQTSFGWEWVFFFAFINVLRFMMPIGIIFTLVGITSGHIINFILKY